MVAFSKNFLFASRGILECRKYLLRAVAKIATFYFALGSNLFFLADLAAKPKDLPTPEPVSQGRQVGIGIPEVYPGRSTTITVEGIATRSSDIVEFEIHKHPAHGVLSPPTRINRETVKYTYTHNGNKTFDIDTVVFRLQTGPEKAWGQFTAKIRVVEPPAKLLLENGNLDFGIVPIGQSKTLPLAIKNEGGGLLEGDLTLNGDSEAPGIWAIKGDANFKLPEGARHVFQVTFSPSAPKPQEGRVCFGMQSPSSSVKLKGEGGYRISVPAEISIDRTGDNATGVLPIESKVSESLTVRIVPSFPVLTSAEVQIPPGVVVKIPLNLEKKKYHVDRVNLDVSDGLATQTLRVNLPPPPAVLEWKNKSLYDYGPVAIRNVPEIPIDLRNAGESTASITLVDGEGGLFLAPSQPRKFSLESGQSTTIRTIWKLPEAVGPAKARITAIDSGISHPLDLVAQVEAPKPKLKEDFTEKPFKTTTSPEPELKFSGKLRRRTDEEIQKSSNKFPDFKTEPVVGWFSVDLKATWTYKGPKPVDFVLEVWGIPPRKKLSSEAFENRLKIPQELPTISVAGWIRGGAAVEGPNGWEATIQNLPPGYHKIRLGTRPHGEEVFYYKQTAGGVFVPAPPAWPKQAVGAAAVLLVGAFLFRRKTRGFFYQEPSD